MTESIFAAAAAFRPVNALEERLVAAARGDRDQQFAFERNLPTETLYVATPDAVPEGEGTPAPATPVRLLSVALKDGRRATAVFTAQERLRAAFGEAVGFLALPGRTLFGMIHADPAILNPGQPYGLIWESSVLAALAGPPAGAVVQKEAQVLLGAPAEIPAELLAALRSALEPLPQVGAAWLALAYWPGATKTVWHLDVRSAADPDPIRRALSGVINDQVSSDRKLDMVINPPGGEDGVGLVVVEPRTGGGGNGKTNGKGLLGRLFRK